jgi:predicted AAA+ superfamily ATPase
MDSEELVQFYSTHIVDNVDLTQKYSRMKPLKHKPYTTLIVGERGVGKTTLAKDIASKIISIHNIERTMSFTNNIGYDFRKLFEEQEKSSSKPILIIFDECFTSNEMNDDKNIRIITAYARLLKIFFNNNNVTTTYENGTFFKDKYGFSVCF